MLAPLGVYFLKLPMQKAIEYEVQQEFAAQHKFFTCFCGRYFSLKLTL